MIIKRTELIFVVVTLTVIWVAAYFNFQRAQVLARDVQRKNDLKAIVSALDDYITDVGTYPPSYDGKILTCYDQGNLRACEWGQDPFESSMSAYMRALPRDPSPDNNRTYIYISTTRDFQIYTSLERKDDIEYNEVVVKRNLYCGSFVCNFGIANGTNKLDVELPAYEPVEN